MLFHVKKSILFIVTCLLSITGTYLSGCSKVAVVSPDACFTVKATNAQGVLDTTSIAKAGQQVIFYYCGTNAEHLIIYTGDEGKNRSVYGNRGDLIDPTERTNGFVKIYTVPGVYTVTVVATNLQAKEFLRVEESKVITIVP